MGKTGSGFVYEIYAKSKKPSISRQAGRQVDSSLSVSVAAGRRRYSATRLSSSRASPTFSVRSLAEL